MREEAWLSSTRVGCLPKAALWLQFRIAVHIRRHFPILTPLQKAAGLYRQDVERHLQFGYGLAQFGMISDFLLQVLQNAVSTGNLLCGLD